MAKSKREQHEEQVIKRLMDRSKSKEWEDYKKQQVLEGEKAYQKALKKGKKGFKYIPAITSKEHQEKKQAGGYLKGPSHKDGGIAAIVDGQEPVELEGGEYIVKKSTVDAVGKKNMDKFNKTGRIPTMATGGKVKKYEKGNKVTIKDLPISKKELTIDRGKRPEVQKEKSVRQLNREIVARNRKKYELKNRIAAEKKRRKEEIFKGTLKAGERAKRQESRKAEFLKREKRQKKIKSKKWYLGKGIDVLKEKLANRKTKKLKEKGVYLEQGGYMPNAPIPAAPPFRQNMRMMGHGGQTSVTNDKAGAGDVSTVHSHSGYKAGE
jgi:hypothetical protein